MTVPTLKHTFQGCLWMHMVTEFIHFNIFAIFHYHIVTNIHCHRIANKLCCFYVLTKPLSLPYAIIIQSIKNKH